MSEIVNQGNYLTRNRVIRNKNNNWEQEQKKKFAKMCESDASYSDIMEFVINENEQNHKMSRINHRIRCFKADGAYQLHQAIEAVFGTVTAQGEKGMSSDGSVTTIPIELADGTKVKVPFGDISLEGLGEGSCISINYDEKRHELVVTGKCQVRYQSLIDDIISETKEGLGTNSIFKGQALEIADINDPKIMDLSAMDNQLMVLSKKTQYDLRPIYARINSPQRCIDKGIPLKFGALLEGSYGTGKTLLAFKLAKEAISKGWSFIYLKDPTILAEAIRMAKTIDRSGWGCIVFTEDIDQVVRGKRDAAMQDILNTLDGGDTKDMNVITLFTTNHIELIEPTFLRGKRIGTIISMGTLDAETADIFIRKSFAVGNYIIKDSLVDVCKMIEASHIAPAFMAEIIEKVKAMMVLADSNEVCADDIKYSVESYLHQVELSQTKDMSETPEQRFVTAYKEVMGVDIDRENIRLIAKALNREWELDGPVK
jgi:transitional endoplasmic reticulum ATPase